MFFYPLDLIIFTVCSVLASKRSSNCTFRSKPCCGSLCSLEMAEVKVESGQTKSTRRRFEEGLLSGTTKDVSVQEGVISVWDEPRNRNSNTAHASTSHSRCFLFQLWDMFRWLLNKLLLFRPLALTAKWLPRDDALGLSQLIYDMCLADYLVFGLIWFTVIHHIIGFVRRDKFRACRPGMIGDMWFMLISFLAQRNAIWNWLIDMSPERLYVYHRWGWIVPAVLGVIHTIAESNWIVYGKHDTGCRAFYYWRLGYQQWTGWAILFSLWCY